MAKEIQIALEIGANFSEAITLPSTQTGRTHRAHIRETIGSTTVKLAFSTGAGNIALSGDTVTLTAGADVTELLSLTTDSAFWVIDIESIGDTAADVRREARGTVFVTRDITRTTEADPAASALGFVAYSEAQTLTDEQKAQARENIGAGTGGGVTSYNDLTDKPTLGTAAALDAPASGNATSGQAVKGDDTRLSDSRAPTPHTHALSDLTQSGATTGQVPTWSGSAWAPATPSGGGGSITTDDITDMTAAGKVIATAANAAAQRAALGLATVATSGAYTDLSGTPTLGTAAALNVPVSGNAASGEVVKGDDSRLAARAQIVTIQSSQAVPVPSWAVTVRVQMWGQGSASGSGRKGAPGTVACGGGAGSSAMYAEITVAAVELGGSVVCVVPGAPAGGAAVTADNTNGNPGAARTSTSAMLGDYLMLVTGGQPGAGGTASTGTAGGSSGTALPAPFLSVAGVTGGSASVTGGVGGGGNNNNWGNAGSGAGGGISDTNVAAAGGGGGYSNVGSTKLMGGTGGGVGVAGNTAVVPTGFHGAGGGGGGGAALTGAAGDGANAVGWGGASGGGGAARNGAGNSSGKGGDGTPGTIRFTFMG